MRTFYFTSLLLIFVFAFNSCTKENAIPTSVTITKIELTDYPLDNNGNNWDATGGTYPDPFITINEGTTTHTNNFYSDYLSDAAGVTVSYTNNFPYTVNTPTADWAFGVWDHDGSLSSSEYMNGLTFKFSDYAADKPTVLTLTAGNITMKIYVEWTF